MNTSKLEEWTKDLLLSNNINFTRHVPITYWEAKDNFYHYGLKTKNKIKVRNLKGTIDFYIPSINLYLEIKGWNNKSNQSFSIKKRLILDQLPNYQVAYNKKQVLSLLKEYEAIKE